MLRKGFSLTAILNYMSSTLSKTLSGQLVLSDQVISGRLRFGVQIERIEKIKEAEEVYILPGFIDAHVHGGGGVDTMDGPEAVLKLARFHASCGVTSILPTTITQRWDKVLAALRGVAEAQRVAQMGADIVGAHLEGPFISPQRLGAQPPFAIQPTPQHVQELFQLDVIRAVTLAPEVSGALEAGLSFARAGVRVGVGHTRADAETVAHFLRRIRQVGGRVAATHLFNAMGGVTAREPGPAGALLTNAEAFIEVILDGFHVAPTSFQLACLAAPDRVMLISDAIRAAGQGDGPSELGGQVVQVEQGRATLLDGTLAGSVLTLDQALRHALQWGYSLPQVSAMLSKIPAQSLGLEDRGCLKEGLRADLVVLNKDFQVQEVYVRGLRC